MTTLSELASGSTISFGGKEIELLEEVDNPTFLEEKKPEMESASHETESSVPYNYNKPPVLNPAALKPFCTPAKFGQSFPVTQQESKHTSMYNLKHPEAVILPRPPIGCSGII